VTSEIISPELRTTLRRLKLSPMLDTLPERLTMARQQKLPYQEFLLLVISDEVTRRDGLAAQTRADKAHLDPNCQLENWDPSAKVSYDMQLLNELATLRFVESNNHVDIVGPVGTGKSFLGQALGHVACRRGYSVLVVRADKMLKGLKHARLSNTYEAELRRLITVDLLIVDDMFLDAMDAQESRDAYEILTERDRAGSMIVTSNRAPEEWLSTFADPMRAQSAIDRFQSNSFDLVIEGESYRPRLKPTIENSRPGSEQSSRPSARAKNHRRRYSAKH
jgi:DNA replication protein DnaC